MTFNTDSFRPKMREYTIWFGGVLAGGLAILASIPFLSFLFKSLISTYPLTSVAVVGGTAYLVGTGTIPTSVPIKAANRAYRSGKAYFEAAYNTAAPVGEEFVTYVIDEDIIGKAANSVYNKAAETMTFMYNHRQEVQESLYTCAGNALYVGMQAFDTAANCAHSAFEAAYSFASEYGKKPEVF